MPFLCKICSIPYRETSPLTLSDRRQVEEVGNPGALYSALMDLIVRLAKSGLIHGDFNEFNLLLKDVPEDAPEGTLPVPILIDFPQMVSTEHENAE